MQEHAERQLITCGASGCHHDGCNAHHRRPELAILKDATRHPHVALESIADDQWTLATPCLEWNLAALVDHITGGNWFTARVLAARPADEAMRLTMKRFAGRSATRNQALGSLNDQFAAFHEPAALHRSWSHVAGTLTGRQILRLRLHDLIVQLGTSRQQSDHQLSCPATWPDGDWTSSSVTNR